MIDKFKNLAKGKKAVIIAVLILTILLATPPIVKAATDGEIDIYGELQLLISRVDDQESKIIQQDAEIEELQGRIEELEAEQQEVTVEEIIVGPTEEVEATTEPETTTAEPIEITNPTKPEPEVAMEPEPEPEPKNPYANVNISGVHIATIDGVVHFGKWLIDIGDAELERQTGVITKEGIVCFNDKEKERNETRLTHLEIDYTTSSIPIDPLLLEIVQGKTFTSRTDAINYIESVIAE